MRVAVCDNDTFFLKEFTDLIDSYIFNRDIMLSFKTFTDYGKLLSCANEFDIFFLDYKMDEIDGLAFAVSLLKISETENG